MKIQKFISETFGNVRGVYLENQPWLYAKEVCKILELGDVYQTVSRLDDDEKRCLESTPPKTYTRKNKTLWLVNEPGFYQLVFTSRTEAAKKFKRWVCHEVLPTIRREGIWQQARDDGKAVRLHLTDTIKTFIEYLKETNQLDRLPVAWYSRFTDLADKAAKVDAKRDLLTAEQLFELDTCERIIARAIEKGMENKLTHHEIWLDVKNKLNAE